MNQVEIDLLLHRLSKNRFRNGFRLKGKDRRYALAKGLETIQKHAVDFVEKRLANKAPENDGKQTPFNGHPVFVAQHATGTCCRSCLAKWLGIDKGRSITIEEQEDIVQLIMEWVRRGLEKEFQEATGPQLEKQEKGQHAEIQQELFRDEDSCDSP